MSAAPNGEKSVCLVCYGEFRQITPSHLKRHQLTLAGYRRWYGLPSRPARERAWPEPFLNGRYSPTT